MVSFPVSPSNHSILHLMELQLVCLKQWRQSMMALMIAFGAQAGGVCGAVVALFWLNSLPTTYAALLLAGVGQFWFARAQEAAREDADRVNQIGFEIVQVYRAIAASALRQD